MMLEDYVSTWTDRSPEVPHAYSCLLRPNSPPSAESCTIIRSLIERQECQLATIEDEIQLVMNRLIELEDRQVHAQDVLFKLRATLAPIKSLPTEILAEIFERCLEKRNSCESFSTSARNKEVLLVLGWVCRSWRTVAHATPRLWQDVIVNVCDGRYSNELRRDAKPVLLTWLSHSGSLPLNLCLVCKTERVVHGLVGLFETIAAHGTRWRTVHIQLQYAPVIYALVGRAFSKCSSLSTFEVTDGGQNLSYLGAHQEGPAIRFDLTCAPLRELSLSLTGLTIRDVHAPWATLTSLAFMQDARSSTTSIADYAAALRQCTSLERCSIAIGSGAGDEVQERFGMPRLECLRLRVNREAARTTQVEAFLKMLGAPRLGALAIEDCCARGEVVLYHGELKTFLRAHGRSLRRFTFSTSSEVFTSGDMVGLVVETPLLTDLEYRPAESSSPRALVEAMTPRVEGELADCLLPCLERLFVYWDTADTASVVADMVERRHALAGRGVARIQRLSCRPVSTSTPHDCTPPRLLAEDVAARLGPRCRCRLQVDAETCRYDLDFLYR